VLDAGAGTGLAGRELAAALGARVVAAAQRGRAGSVRSGW